MVRRNWQMIPHGLSSVPFGLQRWLAPQSQWAVASQAAGPEFSQSTIDNEDFYSIIIWQDKHVHRDKIKGFKPRTVVHKSSSMGSHQMVTLLLSVAVPLHVWGPFDDSEKLSRAAGPNTASYSYARQHVLHTACIHMKRWLNEWMSDSLFFLQAALLCQHSLVNPEMALSCG